MQYSLIAGHLHKLGSTYSSPDVDRPVYWSPDVDGPVNKSPNIVGSTLCVELRTVRLIPFSNCVVELFDIMWSDALIFSRAHT